MANTIKFLSLTGLGMYDAQIKAFINEKLAEGDAPAFKFVNLVDGVLKFYTENPIDENSEAAFEITLPVQDLSHLMALVKDATSGNIGIFNENGQIVDGGIKAADIALKSEVQAAKEAVQAEVDELAGYVGTFEASEGIDTVVKYIDAKTANIASDERVNAIDERLAIVEEDYLVEADKTELAGQISAVDTKADENAAAIADIVKDYLTSVEEKELQDQITANANAIELLTNGVSAEEVDGVNDLIQYVKDHGTEVTGMKEDISDNADAIAQEVSDREAADLELDGKITALGTKVAGDIEAAMAAEVAAREAGDAKALKDAKDYTDAEVAKDRARLDAIEAADVVLEGRVKANEDAIAAINHAETGILAQANVSIKALEDGQVATNKADIEALTKTHADDKAELAGDIAELSQAHADDKAALEAKDTAIEGNVTKLQEDVAALQAIEHKEISQEEIEALFIEA